MKKKFLEEILPRIILGIAIIGCLLAFYYSLPECDAQTHQDNVSEWVEVNSVEIPEGLEIHSGITKNGNPKYWFIIQDIKVFITPKNKEHYINGTATIILVEWYNKSKDRYKYTTRQKKEVKPSKKLNLKEVF